MKHHKLILSVSVLVMAFALSPQMSGQTLNELRAEYDRLTAEYNRLVNECNQAQTAYEQQNDLCSKLQWYSDQLYYLINPESEYDDEGNIKEEEYDMLGAIASEISNYEYINERLEEEIHWLELEYDNAIEAYNEELNYFWEERGWSPEDQAAYEIFYDSLVGHLGYILDEIDGKRLEIEHNASRMADLVDLTDDPEAVMATAQAKSNNAWEVFASLGEHFFQKWNQCEAVRTQREVIKMQIENHH